MNLEKLTYSGENGFERSEDMISDVKKRYKKFEALDNIARAVFMGALSFTGVFFFDEVATDLFLKIVYFFFIIATAACSVIFFRSFIACFTAFPMSRFLKNTSLDTGKLNESNCTSGVLSNDKCGISIGGDYLIVFKSLHFIAVPVSDITYAIKLDRTSRGHSFSGSSHKTEFLHSVAVCTRTNGVKSPIEAFLTEQQCELVCEELIRKGIEVQRIS